MCPSEHEAGFSLELKEKCSSPTSSETYPYPKGEHNGAIGPKDASILKIVQNKIKSKKWQIILFPFQNQTLLFAEDGH